jgi:hypothetical protein
MASGAADRWFLPEHPDHAGTPLIEVRGRGPARVLRGAVDPALLTEATTLVKVRLLDPGVFGVAPMPAGQGAHLVGVGGYLRVAGVAASGGRLWAEHGFWDLTAEGAADAAEAAARLRGIADALAALRGVATPVEPVTDGVLELRYTLPSA